MTAPPVSPSLPTMWRLSPAKIPASTAKLAAAARWDAGSLSGVWWNSWTGRSYASMYPGVAPPSGHREKEKACWSQLKVRVLLEPPGSTGLVSRLVWVFFSLCRSSCVSMDTFVVMLNLFSFSFLQVFKSTFYVMAVAVAVWRHFFQFPRTFPVKLFLI